LQMIARFLLFVEIKTKIASVFPFLLGLSFAALSGKTLDVRAAAVFFFSMLFFDMATTALNNLLDKHKTLSDHSFSLKTETVIFFILFLLAAVFGIFLVSITSLSVLFIGVLCFLVGIFYTFGPISLSHMPVGEAFSGVFMGFFIPLLVVESVLPADAPVLFTINFEKLILTLQLPALLSLILVSAPAVCVIANIMLANNICDQKDDESVGRYTLPYYIGRKYALYLFAFLNFAAYGAQVLAVLLKILPPLALIPLFTLPAVAKNIRRFFAFQSKKETFPLCIQNFLLILVPYIAGIALGAAVK